LKRTLSSVAGLPPDQLLVALEAALDRFQVGAQADDTAALALRPVSSEAAVATAPHAGDRVRTLRASIQES
jgi:hypothetical protein